MVELRPQYLKIKPEIDQAIQEVIDSTRFIGGPKIQAFKNNLETYLGVRHVIPCANGTDALQIAMMVLDLNPGDEVIVPAFTYAATAEVIGLLQLKPVMVDVDVDTFNITREIIEPYITEKTKAIVPVHLFGQSTDMEPIMELAKERGLYVIEDNAQAIGADYIFGNSKKQKTGTIGHIGCTSFFPSKNLGCYGDGGAIFTNDDHLAEKLRMIASHGEKKKYHHEVIGCNSRLDALQAAVLNIKLKHLDQYSKARLSVAEKYDQAFSAVSEIQVPVRQTNSTHVFHQYTLRIKNGKREELKSFLAEKSIPSMIYYPIPLYRQNAYKKYWNGREDLPNVEKLCKEVLSLPIHTEMDKETQEYIINQIIRFFN